MQLSRLGLFLFQRCIKGRSALLSRSTIPGAVRPEQSQLRVNFKRGLKKHHIYHINICDINKGHKGHDWVYQLLQGKSCIELYENQMGRWWSSEATASLGLLTPQIQLKLRVLKVSKAALPRVGSSELVE